MTRGRDLGRRRTTLLNDVDLRPRGLALAGPRTTTPMSLRARGSTREAPDYHRTQWEMKFCTVCATRRGSLTSERRSGTGRSCRCTVPATTAPSCSSSACHPAPARRSLCHSSRCYGWPHSHTPGKPPSPGWGRWRVGMGTDMQLSQAPPDTCFCPSPMLNKGSWTGDGSLSLWLWLSRVPGRIGQGGQVGGALGGVLLVTNRA